MNSKLRLKRIITTLFLAGFFLAFLIFICLKNTTFRVDYNQKSLESSLAIFNNILFHNKLKKSSFYDNVQAKEKKPSEVTFYYFIKGKNKSFLKKHIYIDGKKIKESHIATFDLFSPRSSFVSKNMNGTYINDFSSIFYYDFSKRKLNPMGVYKSDIYRICDWFLDEKEFVLLKEFLRINWDYFPWQNLATTKKFLLLK